MALWPNKPRTQVKTGVNSEPQTLDGGVNKDGNIFNIKSNESWDCLNTSSRIKGALTLNKSPYKYEELSPYTNEIQATCIRDNELHMVSKGIWKYYNLSSGIWTTIKDDVDTTYGTMLNFQTGTTLYTIFANDYCVYSYDGTTVTAISAAPKTYLYTVDDYRLYALKGNVLYISAINDLTIWSETIPLVGATSESTAIIAANDKVYCFTKLSLHILYGDDSDNYSLSESQPVGCSWHNGVIAHNGRLYIANDFGFFSYSDGEGLTNLGKKLNKKFPITTNVVNDDAICIIEFNNTIYIAVYDSYVASNTRIYSLNLDTMVWNVSSNQMGDTQFIVYNDDSLLSSYSEFNPTCLLGISKNGIYVINTITDTTTAWYWITPMKFMGFNKQIISRIPILFDLPIGSTMKLQYNTNSHTASWVDLCTFAPNSNTQNQLIYVPMSVLNNVDMYQLKLSGTGDFVIYYMGVDERVRVR